MCSITDELRHISGVVRKKTTIAILALGRRDMSTETNGHVEAAPCSRGPHRLFHALTSLVAATGLAWCPVSRASNHLPLSLQADWTAEGNQGDDRFGKGKGAHFGSSVNGAGDVNGDGYDDVIVGAPYFDTDALDTGHAYVYYGWAEGPSTSPNWTNWTQFDRSKYGVSVARAGDVNADGFDDIIVMQERRWKTSVYHGSSVGPSRTDDWTYESPLAPLGKYQANRGSQVAAAGDVNGDGFADVILSVQVEGPRHHYRTHAKVFYGSPTGLNASPNWEIGMESALEGGQRWAVACAGDVNGDHFDDVMIGSFLAGWVTVFHGSVTGLSDEPNWSTKGDGIGFTVASAGDVNGDGFDDVLIGNKAKQQPSAVAYYGSATGLSQTPDWTTSVDPIPGPVTVSGAGDVDSDGFCDVLVGNMDYTNGESREGAVFLYRGSATGPNETHAWMAESNQEDAQFGVALAPAGDVNDDGADDVVIGANRYENPLTDEGCAFLYFGRPTTVEHAETDAGDHERHPSGNDPDDVSERVIYHVKLRNGSWYAATQITRHDDAFDTLFTLGNGRELGVKKADIIQTTEKRRKKAEQVILLNDRRVIQVARIVQMKNTDMVRAILTDGGRMQFRRSQIKRIIRHDGSDTADQ